MSETIYSPGPRSLPEVWPVDEYGVADEYAEVFGREPGATPDQPGMLLRQSPEAPDAALLYHNTEGDTRAVLALAKTGLRPVLETMGFEARFYGEVSPGSYGYGYAWPDIQSFINGANSLPADASTLKLEPFPHGLYKAFDLVDYLAQSTIPVGDSHDVSTHGPFLLVLRNSPFLSTMLREQAARLTTQPVEAQAAFTAGFNVVFTGKMLAQVLAQPDNPDAKQLMGDFLSWEGAPSAETFVAETRQAVQKFGQTN